MRRFTPKNVASNLRKFTSQPSRPKPAPAEESRRQRGRTELNTLNIDFDPLRLFDCLHRWKCREAELRDRQFDRFLAMVRGFKGVVTLPDIMALFGMNRQQAHRLLLPYLTDGYCKLLDENDGEPLYYFPRLAPATLACVYCGSVFPDDGHHHACCNCGARL